MPQGCDVAKNNGVVRVPVAPQTLEALKAMTSASATGIAHWCLKCGQIRLLDPMEVVLAPGDPKCLEELTTSTPQQCLDAFSKTTGADGRDEIERLRAELGALDDLLSRPTSNLERSRLLSDREAKALELEALENAPR